MLNSDFKVDATNMVLIYDPESRVTLEQQVALNRDTAEVLLNHMNWRTNVSLENEFGVYDLYDLYLFYSFYGERLAELLEKWKKIQENWNEPMLLL